MDLAASVDLHPQHDKEALMSSITTIEGRSVLGVRRLHPESLAELVELPAGDWDRLTVAERELCCAPELRA
jgi:hypothetical protein